jgi:Methylamine utilisation protein MauE
MGAAGAAAAWANGCAVSCGALLALAGTSKLYRGVRGVAGSSAIRRALRLTKRRWRRVELAAGGFECAVGLVVCSRVAPLPGCAAMAMLGAGFCALLGYARKKRVSGNCGCIQWRPAPATSVQAVSRREIARAALLSAAGVAGALSAAHQPGAADRGWFGAGMLAGAAAAVLLSVSGPPRTPVCRRRLWLPGRATLRALTRHTVFTAMAESAGPLGPVARHSREGCADEFWFPVPAEGGASRAVVFQVRHRGRGGNLAVHASLRETARNH